MTPEKAKQLEQDMERLKSIPLQEVECEIRSEEPNEKVAVATHIVSD